MQRKRKLSWLCQCVDPGRNALGPPPPRSPSAASAASAASASSTTTVSRSRTPTSAKRSPGAPPTAAGGTPTFNRCRRGSTPVSLATRTRSAATVASAGTPERIAVRPSWRRRSVNVAMALGAGGAPSEPGDTAEGVAVPGRALGYDESRNFSTASCRTCIRAGSDLSGRVRPHPLGGREKERKHLQSRLCVRTRLDITMRKAFLCTHDQASPCGTHVQAGSALDFGSRKKP